MGSLVKRSKKYYYYYKDSSGKVHGKVISSDLATAKEFKAAQDNRFNRRRLGLPDEHIENRKWGIFKGKYCAYIKEHMRSSTEKIHLTAIRNLERLVCPVWIFDLNVETMDSFKTLRAKEVKSPTTVNIELRALKAMINRAIKWKYLPYFETSDIEYLVVEDKITFLEDDEIKKLLAASEGLFRNILLVGLYAGMRLGEVLNLEWDNLDFKSNFIKIMSKKTWKTKTGKTRIVPMHPNIRKALEPMKQQRGYVFKTSNGNKLIITDVAHRFKRLVKKAGIKYCTYHTLRHTFATHLLRKGVDIYRVSKLLGHSSVKVTEKVIV